MRKRSVLSLLLALVMALGLSIPAAAYELPTGYHIYQCYEGFASLQDFTGDQLNGYVNQAGEVVIPCIYGRYYGAGDTLVGHFHNGRVWVLKKDYSMDFQTWQPAEDTWEVAQLDEQGNMVVPWKEVPAYAPGLHMVNDGGVCHDCGEGNLPSSEVQMPEPKEPESTRYRSTAELTAVSACDMDAGEFFVRVTNDTDSHDSGTVALVLASDPASVSFIDYELPPHTSATYSVGVVGLVSNTTLQLFVHFDSWEGLVNASIITFESDEDLAAYRSTIPHEVNSHYAGLIAQLREGTSYVCWDRQGDDWLRDYAGITRTKQPYIYPDDNHSLCVTK